ncbi:MAG: dTMP kinase [Christensenellales bacterium]|jgi:dTMP kinase
MGRGLFITFEGQDGSGKSTQIAMLADWLTIEGHEVYNTREPGGTPVGEAIRDILLDPAHRGMTAQCEALLYAAARAQIVREKIVPALEAGRMVLCDRFIHSSLAYQGYGRELGEEAVLSINRPALAGLWPDLTFYFSMEPHQGLDRVKGRGLDRLESENGDFHERVRRGFMTLAQRDEKIVSVDAGLSREEIARTIRRHVKRLMD